MRRDRRDLPIRNGPDLVFSTNVPEVTLWVYNRKRDAHRRILNFEGGGISWDRTNDLYDVNVAL